jgi:hypothetical protein
MLVLFLGALWEEHAGEVDASLHHDVPRARAAKINHGCSLSCCRG